MIEIAGGILLAIVAIIAIIGAVALVVAYPKKVFLALAWVAITGVWLLSLVADYR